MRKIFNQRFGELTKLTSNTFPDLVRNRYLTEQGKMKFIEVFLRKGGIYD